VDSYSVGLSEGIGVPDATPVSRHNLGTVRAPVPDHQCANTVDVGAAKSGTPAGLAVGEWALARRRFEASKLGGWPQWLST
jgi:hypothetical protein